MLLQGAEDGGFKVHTVLGNVDELVVKVEVEVFGLVGKRFF